MHWKRPTGMTAFTVVWFGQIVSLLGTGMSSFALIYWVYRMTGTATSLALAGLFWSLPAVLLSPLAGALVDRWNRKLVMMLSDIGAGVSSLTLLTLYATGHLQVWHLYAATAFAAAFQSFQWPAYSAAISTMLPKEQYGRANGMIALAESGAGILAPILAGILMVWIDISGILLIDVVTFVVGIAALLVVHVPQPNRSSDGQEAQGSLWQEAAYGFSYIWRRPSLLSLQMVFFFVNFFASFGYSVLPAMILGRTGNNAAIFGSVQSAFAIGGVAGGLLMSTWGGPRRRVYGLLFSMALASVFGDALLGLGRGLPVWALAAFSSGLLMTVLNSCSQAIWQAKVAPDVQGRVFSVRRLIAQVASPLGMLLAGPLADRIMEPGMQAGGALAAVFGPLVGTGPGTGISVMFVLVGIAGLTVALAGLAVPLIRNVETLVPDHDAVA